MTWLTIAGTGAALGASNRIRAVRRSLLASLDPIASRYGTYTAYQLEREEFVGTVTLDRWEAALRDAGYGVNPLAAAKYHPDTSDPDDGSWRRVDEDNPRWQWHIHAWIGDAGRVELFSHYEYRPDPWLLSGESPTDMSQRLRDHYHPKWDTEYDADDANYFLGDACPRLRDLVGD